MVWRVTKTKRECLKEMLILRHLQLHTPGTTAVGKGFRDSSVWVGFFKDHPPTTKPKEKWRCMVPFGEFSGSALLLANEC